MLRTSSGCRAGRLATGDSTRRTAPHGSCGLGGRSRRSSQSPPASACRARTRLRRGAGSRRSPCRASFLATRRAHRTEPRDTLAQDQGDVSQRLDVVHQCRRRLVDGRPLRPSGRRPQSGRSRRVADRYPSTPRRTWRDAGTAGALPRPPAEPVSSPNRYSDGPSTIVTSMSSNHPRRLHLVDRAAECGELERERRLGGHDHTRRADRPGTINAPSSTRNGLRRSRRRSLNVPGSPSAAFTTTVVDTNGDAKSATFRHLTPVGKPAAPARAGRKPRRPR